MKQIVLFFFIIVLWRADIAEAYKREIGFFLYKVNGVAPWDPDTTATGITGSEESVIYLAQKLADLDYKVTVYGDPPAGSRYSAPLANPRYLPCDCSESHKLDIAISWRMADAAQRLKAHACKVYLWPHDIICHSLSPDQIKAFDGVLWISQWQKLQWISVNPPFAAFQEVFGNGINPPKILAEENYSKPNPYSCIYGSNYSRGLEVLLDCWPAVKKNFPKAKLDIYYGWQHWGQLSTEKEKKMRRQVVELQPLDVYEHGLVGHEELDRAYEAASFWTYPCTSPETFCITALRAQMRGAIPVIIEGSALAETVPNGYKCSSQEQYLELLTKAMKEVETIQTDKRREMADFILEKFTWEKIAEKWDSYFNAQFEVTLPKPQG